MDVRARRNGANKGAAPQITSQYSEALRSLEQDLAAGRDKLDPVTVAILEENLRAIDSAITEARGALARDPGNLYLNQHLESTMKKKIQLLRTATARPLFDMWKPLSACVPVVTGRTAPALGASLRAGGYGW